SGTLTFAAGETSKTFTVRVLEDTLFEGDETINLTLSSPQGGAVLGSPSGAVLTIHDNDQPKPGQLTFSAATGGVAENGGSITLTVPRAGGSDGVVSVAYATGGGTATAGSDYTAASGTLTFANGQTTQTVTVPILDDTLFEGAETFNITLTSPTG